MYCVLLCGMLPLFIVVTLFLVQFISRIIQAVVDLFMGSVHGKADSLNDKYPLYIIFNIVTSQINGWPR